MSRNIITVDGPAGSGKGSLAIRLANYLSWHYLDSGVFYRALAYESNRLGVHSTDIISLSKIITTMELVTKIVSDTVNITLNGRNVTKDLRLDFIAEQASIISAYAEIREALLQHQQDYYQEPGLVTDGRDMGTTVFPDAKWKIYLQVSPDVAAVRRFRQLQSLGVTVKIENVLSEIKQRDMRDSKREYSPLRAAPGSYVLDTDNLDEDQVLDKVLLFIETGKNI